MLADLRYALRQLKKSPGFTLTAVLTLALGIGATTAIFTLFDQVMLRMLPVEKPQELVRLSWRGSFSGSTWNFGGNVGDFFSYPMYKDLRQRNQVFSEVAAVTRNSVGIAWHNQSEIQDVEVVSGNYFQTLGVHPSIGRLFSSSDETGKDANPVVVLSYNYWRTRFAASPQVIGQDLLLNGHPFTIVGVTPENFYSAIGGSHPGVFVPLTMVDTALPWMARQHNLDNHLSLWITVFARLKPGVSMAQAQAGLSPLWYSLRTQELSLYTNVSQQFKERYTSRSTIRLQDNSMGFSPSRSQLKTPLVILLSMAGLLIGMCALNVTTLLLLRAAVRAREISMRYALGAKFRRIVCQLLIEGGVLGAIGAASGIAFAPLLTSTLVHLLTNANPGNEPYSAAIDSRVLVFTILLSLSVTILFSIAPIFAFLHPNLMSTLRQNAGTASKGSQLFRKLAVGGQITLSVLLLAGAGLFVRTVDHLRHQPVGFQTDRLITFALDPTVSGYSEAHTPAVLTSAMEGIRRIPGVEIVAGTTDPELSGYSNFSGFAVEAHKQIEGEDLNFESPWVTPAYFATLHQSLLAGREFTEADAKGAPKVAVVNQSMAVRFFGSAQNALGRKLSRDSEADRPLDITIIGVVGNTRHFDLRTPLGPAVYLPYLQMPNPVGLQLYIRTSQRPQFIAAAIRKVVHDIDQALVVDTLRTMSEQVDVSAATERALAILAIGFAGMALTLASVGLYGVLAFSTESRTREIGVRLALGSPRMAVISLVLREMAWIASLAILIAIPSTIALARLFRSQLYGVAVSDPLTLLAAVGFTVLMLGLSSALPAGQAARVEPVEALRTE